MKFTEPLQIYLLTCQANSAFLGRFFLHWAAATLKDFKTKNSRPLFNIICKLKNGNFKTRDFNPLIKRVLAGVRHLYSKNKSVVNNRNLSEMSDVRSGLFG